MRSRARPAVRWGVVAGIAVLTALACLVPAVLGLVAPPQRTLLTAGHAGLVATAPAQGSVLARQPARVSATFNQSVGLGPGGLQVFTPSGARADRGAAGHSGPDTITVALAGGLGQGTFTVAWHVISADSHPVQGAFTFSVGRPSPTHVGAAGRNAGSPAVDVMYGVVRGLAYGFFVLLGGVVAFLLVCWPAGAARRGVRRLVGVGWVGLLGTSVCALLVQGPYAADQGLGRVLRPDLLAQTLHSRIGAALQAREVLTVVAAVVTMVLLPRLATAGTRLRVAAGAGWALLVVGIAATWASYDHASVGSQVALALPADVLHLAAAAVWLGGLVTAVLCVLRRPDTDSAAVLRRFSAVALGCVAAIVATGAYQAWRQVGSWAALVATDYGRLVLVKIGCLTVLIGLGCVARRYLHIRPVSAPARALAMVGARAPGTEPRRPPEVVPLRRLRRSVAVELGVAAVILAVTAALVNTPTGRESYSRPTDATLRFSITGSAADTRTLDAFVTPARLGANRLDLYLTGADRRPYTPAQIQANLYLPARDLGPFTVALRPAGPGHYTSPRALCTVTGQWQLRVTIRGDAFDETTVTVPVTVY